jgi:hypothetical protein
LFFINIYDSNIGPPIVLINIERIYTQFCGQWRVRVMVESNRMRSDDQPALVQAVLSATEKLSALDAQDQQQTPAYRDALKQFALRWFVLEQEHKTRL